MKKLNKELLELREIAPKMARSIAFAIPKDCGLTFCPKDIVAVFISKQEVDNFRENNNNCEIYETTKGLQNYFIRLYALIIEYDNANFIEKLIVAHNLKLLLDFSSCPQIVVEKINK